MRPSRRQVLQGVAAFAAASGFTGFGTLQAKRLDDDFFELRARKTTAPLVGEGGPQTPVWAYNDMVPGQELRVRRGQTVRIRFINELDEPSSIHWHGIRIENDMDGVSGLTQKAVEPGEQFDYVFTVPDSGTYWYHAHNRSWEQVARGLYGVLIVEEDEPVFAPEHDLTLVIDDWRLKRDGTLEEESFGTFAEWAHGGRLGNWLTVNGGPQPDFKIATGQPHRVRLINACNSRVLELDPNAIGAKILAEDGQPYLTPLTLDYSPYLLGPAQRVDLLVQVQEQGTLELREVSGKPFAVASFSAAQDTGAVSAPSSVVIPPNNLPAPDLQNAVSLKLVMEGGAMGRMRGAIVDGVYLEGRKLMDRKQMWSFNGVAGLAMAPFFSIERGRTVLLEILNETSWLHAMHVHGHHFQVLERNGTPDRNLPWRDTFMIGPSGAAKIAFVADNPGKWLLHCHMLEHQAAGMKTWFDVTT